MLPEFTLKSICKSCSKDHLIAKSEKNSSKPIISNSEYLNYKNPECPECSSIKVHKKGKTKSTQRFICNGCGKNWSVPFENLQIEDLQSSSNLRSTKRKDKVTNKSIEIFEREISLDKTLDYLKDKLRNNQPIEFYYKDKSQISRYEKFTMQGDTYINCYSTKYGNKVYKYRIDRIRNIVN